MKLLKTFTLILCMSVAACSSHKADDANSAGGLSWWPFGKKETVAKVEMPDQKVTDAWLDEYEPRVRDALKDSKFQVERREHLLVVTAPVDASFNKDRPEMLLPVSLGPVTKVAKLVENDPKTAVLVLGHADSAGTPQTNLKLSQQRAQAVAAIFRLSGLKGDRLMLKGVGSDMPRAANDSVEGRSLNRRVEIMLTPQDTLLALLAKYNQPVADATLTPALDPAAQKLAAIDKPKALATGQAK